LACLSIAAGVEVSSCSLGVVIVGFCAVTELGDGAGDDDDVVVINISDFASVVDVSVASVVPAASVVSLASSASVVAVVSLVSDASVVSDADASTGPVDSVDSDFVTVVVVVCAVEGDVGAGIVFGSIDGGDGAIVVAAPAVVCGSSLISLFIMVIK
jgi:hypothetical protein